MSWGGIGGAFVFRSLEAGDGVIPLDASILQGA